MYRKYSSSTKSSRNERLAQLTEQESVIERKKREILAKIEAQKKKETEEALKKLEPPHTNKRDNLHSYKKNSWNREKEVEDEEESIVCPRNAFSNDGSFLDQFKKLSSTGLGPKNVDVTTLKKVTKREEEVNRVRKPGKEGTERDGKESGFTTQTGNDSERLGHDPQKDAKSHNCHRSPNSKFQDSNIQLQLPPPGVVQLVPQVTVGASSTTTNSKAYSQSLTNNPVSVQSVSLNTVTRGDIKLNSAVSQLPVIEAQHGISYQFSSPYQSNSSEDGAKKISSQSDVTPTSHSLVSVASIEPPLPMVPQNIPPPTPIQVHNIPPPPTVPHSLRDFGMKQKGNISYSQEKNESKQTDDEDTSFSNFSEKEDIDINRKKNVKNEEFSVPVHSMNLSSISDDISLDRVSSLEDTESTRISPALTVNEADERKVIKNSYFGEAVSRHGKDAEDSICNRGFDKGNRRHSVEKNFNDDTSHDRSPDCELPRKLHELERFSKVDRTRDSDTFSDEGGIERKRKKTSSEYDSSDSDTNSRDSYQSNCKVSRNDSHSEAGKSVRDGYQADCEDESSSSKTFQQRHKKISFHKSLSDDTFRTGKGIEQNKRREKEKSETGENSASTEKPKRKKKSRWGDEVVPANSSNTGSSLGIQLPSNIPPLTSAPAGKAPLLSKLTRSDPGLVQYARQTFGSTNLSEEDWKKAEDHYKINLLYQDMVKKRAEIDRLEKAGKFKYEYDSDEDVEGGTWEHKLRQQEMMATQLWADELTRQAAGKHHIGDFLPPEELERFMEKYNAVKQGRKPDLSDYKEFKLKEDNVGYRLLQKMGWNEGQGLGQYGTGITNPVNKASTRHENQGLGVDRPDGLQAGDDEYDAYRKRMMLAYRFRPNPLNNPRRPYY